MSMKITDLGPAALMVEHAGRRLVMDPWLEEPNYLNSRWHDPPLALKTEDVFPVTWAWCQHDHLHPPTLAKVPRDTTFLVPQYRSQAVDRHRSELGFENRTPLHFGEKLDLGKGLWVRCLRTDLIWVREGDDGSWNLKITLSDAILQQGIDKTVCWDEVLFSFRHQMAAENPEFFNEAFFAMLYNSEDLFLGDSLERTATSA